jgi:hypothetical protein
MAHFVGGMFFILVGIIVGGYGIFNCVDMRWDTATIFENLRRIIGGVIALVIGFMFLFHFI